MLTDNHGFIQEFSSPDEADKHGSEWVDGETYRNFKVFAEDE